MSRDDESDRRVPHVWTDPVPMLPSQPMATPVRDFVRSAWTVLTFQLLAAAGAVAVTGWAALQVGPLLEQREKLGSDVANLQQTRTDLAAEIARLQGSLSISRQEARVRAAPIIREGINFFQRREYEQASEAYNRALELDPGNAYVLDLLSYSQFKRGDLDGAIASVEQALRVDPGYEWGYTELVRYACSAERFDLAEQTYADAVTRDAGIAALFSRLFNGGDGAEFDGEFRTACMPIAARFAP